MRKPTIGQLTSLAVLISLASPPSEASAMDDRLGQGSDWAFPPSLNSTVASNLESSLTNLAKSLTTLTNTFAKALQGRKDAAPAAKDLSASSKPGLRNVVASDFLQATSNRVRWDQLGPNVWRTAYQVGSRIMTQYLFKRADGSAELVDSNGPFYTGELGYVGQWMQTPCPSVLLRADHKLVAFREQPNLWLLVPATAGNDFQPQEQQWLAQAGLTTTISADGYALFATRTPK